MRTSMALVVKFIITFVAALIAFYFLMTNDLIWIFLVALLATIANYLIGDLIILPSMGNIVASIADGFMAGLVAYIFDFFLPVFTTTWATLLWFAIIIAVGEYFFHIYLKEDEKVAP
ncbi:DUF2512 family protein [Natronospora cellulosivora (SeqCode)]